MADERNAAARRRPFAVLTVFAVAFCLQGMSLSVFHSDRQVGGANDGAAHTKGAQILISERFTVTTTEDGGPGSLRQAIIDANASPGLDEIRFAFAEPITIALRSDLPVVTDPVSLDVSLPVVTVTHLSLHTVDGSNVSGDVFDISDAPGTSIRGVRVVNADKGYGFVVREGSDRTMVISSTVQHSLGGIRLENAGQITLTHNAFFDLRDAGIEATDINALWLVENNLRNIGGNGIRLLDGVQNALVLSNTLSGIFQEFGAAVVVAGDPAPTDVLIRNNHFTNTFKPIELGPGANFGFPPPEVLEATHQITITTDFESPVELNVRSPADPGIYAYPLTLDVYRVRDGHYLPLGITVPYSANDFPGVVTHSKVLTNVNVGDQLAVIATTANPNTSEFSPPVDITEVVDRDQDDDGVDDSIDMCPDTAIPETGVPLVRLGGNRFALVDGDFNFDTTAPEGNGPQRAYTTTDTGGCSCEQIIDAVGAGRGHVGFGCSISVMDEWVADVGSAAKQGGALAPAPPRSFALDQNYPNPFNPTTNISFHVPEPSFVRLRVYDLLGREVATLVNREMEAGMHQVQWNGRDAVGLPVTSGIYVYRIDAGDFSRAKTMILLQ